MVAAAIVGSAAVGAISSNRASNAQQGAANQANDTNRASLEEQRRQYDLARSDQAPYREAGYNALSMLNKGIGEGGEFTKTFGQTDFQGDPGYQFRLTQGQQALDRSAAARGGLQSGAALKAAARYGQDFASNEYGNAYNRFVQDQTNRYNRLAGVAGTGQQAVNNTTAAGQNYANSVAGINNNIAQNQIGAGNAQASSYIGGANALAGGVGQYMNYQNSQNYLNALNSNRGYYVPPGNAGGYTNAGYPEP